MKNKYLRIFIILLVIISFFNISIKGNEIKNVTIFLVDRSLSVNNSEELIKEFIEKQIKNKTVNDFYSIISFGKNISTEINFTNLEKEINFSGKIDINQTNIENALNIAKAKFPDESNKQIVLITDGNENSGNSIENVDLENIKLKILKIEKDNVKEVLISNALIPNNLSINEKFNLEIEIESNIKTKSKLKVYNNRSLISVKDVLIEKGTNNFIIEDQIFKSGYVNYKIEIIPEIDTFLSNNIFVVNTEIFGDKNILIINGESNESRVMKEILSLMNINLVFINHNEVPVTLNELNKYSTIIINDVSLEKLNDTFIKNLSVYVEKLGGGLLVTGGKNSFALGGYYKSELERILPVDMEMKIDNEIPDLSLLIIIDKSGSMSGNKLSTAKEAAKLALDSLKIKDKIAVISFDSEATVDLELTEHNEKEKVINQIDNIGVGGGTSIIPALVKGYEIMSEADTKLKHVILITDGMAEQNGYDSILQKYNDDNMTITTIGIGVGSDQRTLSMIASKTEGRFYLVDQYNQIPKIFTKETFLASKSYLNNEILFPIVTANSEIMKNIDKIPSLNGYISSSIKPTAKMVLASETMEPILSTFEIGSGKTIAWCSDISGFWSSDFINTIEGQQIIKNIVKWTYKDLDSNNILVSENIDGDTIDIIVKVDNYEIGNRLSIERIDTKEIKSFNLIKPKIFQTTFDNIEAGLIPFKITEYGEDNQILGEKILFESINYSEEYNVFENKSIIEDLILQKNAQMIDEGTNIFDFENSNNNVKKVLISKYFIILAIIIFVIEIANRKLLLFSKFKKKEKRKETISNSQEKLEKKEIIVEDEKYLDSSRLLKNKNKKSRF
jgi:Mg-chelatase subunit ChlD